MDEKIKKFFWPAVIIVFIMVITAGMFIFMLKKISNKEQPMSTDSGYLIPNVPYFGIYNHRKELVRIPSGYLKNTSCDSVLSILEYWNPGQNNFLTVCDSLQKKSGKNEFIQIFEENNLTAKSVSLSLSDLKKYINSESKTPLILFLPIANDQPDSVAFTPVNIIIGIDEKNQKLIFHNYWLGNNYEMTFDEFNQLENKLQPNRRNKYIVAQPKNLDEKLREISQRKIEVYPNRTETMKQGEQMFKDYAFGSSGAYGAGLWPQALEYMSKVENSPNFDKFFPPYFKVLLYYQKSRIYFLKNDFDNALAYAEKAVAIDYDLDKSFNDWNGYETNYVRPDRLGIVPEPFVALGDVLDKKGDLQGALAAYKKASNLMLFSKKVDASIKNVEFEMARKGILE